MAYPRANAVAEIGWSSPEHKNWEDYLDRLQYSIQKMAILWSELQQPITRVFHHRHRGHRGDLVYDLRL